jgi:hypothetical protein
MSQPDPFGPWAPDLDPAEKLARLRSMRTLVMIFVGSSHPLARALAAAETDPTDASTETAWRALEAMPALKRRHILASLGALMRTTPDRRRAG